MRHERATTPKQTVKRAHGAPPSTIQPRRGVDIRLSGARRDIIPQPIGYPLPESTLDAVADLLGLDLEFLLSRHARTEEMVVYPRDAGRIGSLDPPGGPLATTATTGSSNLRRLAPHVRPDQASRARSDYPGAHVRSGILCGRALAESALPAVSLPA